MSEQLDQSFKTLKQTIPLLLKHKIPAVPTNYALWYTYVDKANSALNKEIEQALADGRPFSKIYSKELYRKHLADKEELNGWQLRQNVEAMLIELSQSVSDTKTNTQGFKSTMDSCLDDLNKVEKEGWSMDEVMHLVRTMVRETQAIHNSTLDFSTSLQKAEQEVARLRQELEKSQHDAFYDALTDLYNRRYLDQEIHSISEQQQACLIMLDVDFFKEVNDQYGHQMGDRVLKAIAKKLKEKCQNNAIPFRFGGEEFAILMRGATLQQAIHKAELLRQALAKISVLDRRSNQRIKGITASFGVAAYQPGSRSSDLLETADRQLYQAKRLGRNRVMPMRG
ncbi:MAG: GGDEF domain-containing protein [Pseudomonadota bacterium]